MDFAKGIDEITEAVINAAELDVSKRDEIIEQLNELSYQATLADEERAKPVLLKGIVNSLAMALGAVGSLAEIWSTWGGTIKGFLGI